MRRFKPVPIPEEDLEKLLFALQRAPTDASAQLYSAIRVRDPRLRDEVARLSGDQEHIRQYVRAASAWAKENDFGPLKQYIDEFVLGPADHAAYLEHIGIRRLLSLNEY